MMEDKNSTVQDTTVITLEALAAMLNNKLCSIEEQARVNTEAMQGQLRENNENINEKLRENTEAMQEQLRQNNENINEKLRENTETMQERLRETSENINKKLQDSISEIQGQFCEVKYVCERVDKRVDENMKHLESHINTVESDFVAFKEQVMKMQTGTENGLDNLTALMKTVLDETSSNTSKVGKFEQNVEECKTEIRQLDKKVEESMHTIPVVQQKVVDLEKTVQGRFQQCILKCVNLEMRVSEVEGEVSSKINDTNVNPETNETRRCGNNERHYEMMNSSRTMETMYKPLQLSELRHLTKFSGELDGKMTAREFLDKFESEMNILKVDPKDYMIALSYTLQKSALSWLNLYKSQFQSFDQFKVSFLEHFNASQVVASKLSILRTQMYSPDMNMSVTEFVSSRFQDILSLAPAECENIIVSQLFTLIPRKYQNLLVGRQFNGIHEFLYAIRSIENYMAHNSGFTDVSNSSQYRRNEYRNYNHGKNAISYPRVNRVGFSDPGMSNTHTNQSFQNGMNMSASSRRRNYMPFRRYQYSNSNNSNSRFANENYSRFRDHSNVVQHDFSQPPPGYRNSTYLGQFQNGNPYQSVVNGVYQNRNVEHGNANTTSNASD